jgi:hypothetical protein
MTEKDFLLQVWRPYDKITTADGVPGKVLGVSFTTKSVRAFISGAPEWVSCTLIDTHTTGRGKDGNDVAIIEELHNKVLKQSEEIERLKTEKQALADKNSKNYLENLLRAMNMVKEGIQEKKSKINKIENGLNTLQEALEKMDAQDN